MSGKALFTGFETGTGVSLSASQGRVSRGPVSISAWAVPAGDPWSGASENETLSVSVEEVLPEGDAFAPLGVEFRIRVSGSPVGDRPAEADWETSLDPTFTGIQTVLHTGDNGLYKNEWVGAPAHRDKAHEYGNNPGHVYSLPGSYDVRVYAYDKYGNWGVWQRSTPLEVLNPDDTFDAASTIVLDPDGDFSGAPHEGSLPSANMVTTLTDAVNRFNAIKQSVSKGVRVTVRSGALIEEFSETTCDLVFTNGRCCFDIFGGTDQMTYTEQTSAAPSLAEPRVAFFRPQGGGDFCWNIAMRGWKLLFNAYNPETGGPWFGFQNGALRDDFFFPVSDRGESLAHNFRNIFDDVEVQGLAGQPLGTSPQFTNRSSGFFLKDCIFKNNTEYRVLHSSNLFLLGCKFDEDFGLELGLMGADRVAGGPRGYKGHPTIRDGASRIAYIRATFMESRGAWSGQLAGSTANSEQLTYRVVKTGDVSHRKFYVCDSVFVGDIIVGKHHDSDSGYQSVYECCMLFLDPQNYLRDKAYITGMGGGKVFRNCQHIVLNTPELEDANDAALAGKNLEKFEVNSNNMQTGHFSNFYEVDRQQDCLGLRMELIHNDYIMLRPTSEIRNPPHGIYDETVIFKDNGANPTGQMDTVSNLYDVHVGNNVHYAPRIDTPIGPDPADMETLDLPAGFRILDVWMKMIWELQTYTLDPPGLDTGETTPVIPYPDDWYGNQTTQADYSGSLGNHSVRLSGSNKDYIQQPYGFNIKDIPVDELDAITVNFQSSGFTVTNRSGVTWPAGGITIILDRGSTAMEPDTLAEVDPTEVKLYRAATAQPLDAGIDSALFDFNRNLRPNAGFAISPSSGTNAAGAVLPA
jgi:hypothetical protein